MHKQLLLLVTALMLACGVDAVTPTITSFSPSGGPVGTLVIIAGTNLSSPTAFTIGGVAAIVISNSGTTLVGMVMPGAATGAVSVTTAGGTATGSGNFTITPTGHPSTQQGPKLVGTGAVGFANQGHSVAISGDGNTVIIGGDADSSTRGAAWVFNRSGTAWTQQGHKLVGTGATGLAQQGLSVSLSADGNTAIIGGPADSVDYGAAWVFIRSGATWAQQGRKLAGTGVVGSAQQGFCASLSADGNTAVIGGPSDNFAGAAWVFSRSGPAWTQQGLKLVGTGAVGDAQQGVAISLSADGNTVMVGGPQDSNSRGATWVFSRSGTTWTQQGPKLVGTGAVGNAQQGFSVSLSADGNTAMVGGLNDSSGRGAAWVFKRSGTTWTQQGPKLVGTGAVGAARQGYSVSLSADGNTAIASGVTDSSGLGATWVFSCSGGIWTQQGYKLVGNGSVGGSNQGNFVSLSADGNTAIAGGRYDDSLMGASWIFVSDTASYCSPGASSLSHSICSGSSYIFGTHTLTTSGTYHDTLTGSGGCDSIVTLTLAVNNLPAQPTITHTGNSLSTTATGVHYQWQRNGSNLPGDTNSILLITQNGTYTLVVTDQNGCSSTSASVNVTSVGIADMSVDEMNIRIYPNPASESFTLAAGADMLGASYSFSDIMGRMIESNVIEKENTVVSVTGLSSGIYIFQINGLSYKVVKE